MLESKSMADITDTPIHVAIIDDSMADARFLERLITSLPEWSIETTTYNCPDDAFNQLKESPPDVLILDYLLGLGRMNGIEVMERYQAEGLNTAMILMTGHGCENVAADALRAGAMDYLIKDSLSAENLARSLRYVCERKKSNEALQELALCDPLTGLANRNDFHRRLDEALKAANREDTFIALMLLDLDKFKNINDTFGHLIGDEFLKLVAGVLKETTRETDTVARFGGDEFAVILTGLKGTERVAHVAERIVKSLSKPITLDGCLIKSGTSAGISLYPKDSTDIEELFDSADKALYAAKEDGRNNFQFFDARMNEKAKVERVFENDMKQALVRDEFLLHYQPQLDISNNQVVGVEALECWQHPERGLLLPADYIDIAEANGSTSKISEKLIREACRQGKEWQSAGIAPFCLAVNVFPSQFKDENFVGMLETILTETGFDPQWLELEITESLLMGDVDRTFDWLQRLRKIGVRLAIDNFGTGQSSLAYLKKFPIQKMKIDRSFVDHLDGEKINASITDAMIKFGQCLDLDVIAEGVETQEQVEALLSMDCHKVQGDFYSKPLPADEFLAWNRHQPAAKSVESPPMAMSEPSPGV